MQRTIYLDVLKILAIVAVVAIHSSAGLLYLYTSIPSLDWWTTNILHALSRWAVPVFIMASGALLLKPNAQEPASVFYKKRVARVAIPLVFWWLFYLFWVNKSNVVGMLSPSFLKHTLLYQAPQYHLYFLFIIAGLYVVTPLLRSIFSQLSPKNTIGLVALFFAPFLTWWHRDFLYVLWIPFLFYYTAPKALEYTQHLVKKTWLVATFLSASLLILLLTSYRFFTNHWSPTYFYDYTNPIVAMQAISIFLLFQKKEPYFQSLSHGTQSMLSQLAGLTFGVYLISPFVQDMVWDWFKLSESFQVSTPTLLMHIVLSVIASFLLSFMISKTPFLKKTIGY
ncbi:MAG: acyltransferase family protein [Pseudomonadales bacterium]|nr:acyltransferase family protein [Candidatus Woesebacteria bacterium]MCB9801668.1 acyltransferase family protein [Pseudomonadales bacterium]